MFKLVKFFDWKSRRYVPFKRFDDGARSITHNNEENPGDALNGRLSPLSISSEKDFPSKKSGIAEIFVSYN